MYEGLPPECMLLTACMMLLLMFTQKPEMSQSPVTSLTGMAYWQPSVHLNINSRYHYTINYYTDLDRLG